jgi:hypothetical protein
MKLARALALAGAAAFAFIGTAVLAQQAPKFEVDASWPKPLPNNWIFGQIGGIFVDKDDNVWISQRPRTVNDRDKRAERGDKSICCYTAPSVVEFNQAGDVVKAWGGRRPPRAMTGRKTSTACLSTTKAMSGSAATARTTA